MAPALAGSQQGRHLPPVRGFSPQPKPNAGQARPGDGGTGPPPVAPVYGFRSSGASIIPAPPEETQRVVSALVKRASNEALAILRDSFAAQTGQFQADVHADVAFLRGKALARLASDDPRMVLAGVEAWDRAVTNGRLNLGLPSKIESRPENQHAAITIPADPQRKRTT